MDTLGPVLTQTWGGHERRGGRVTGMKRTLTLGAVWTASAAAAVGLGFLAVSLVDASASPATSSTATSADDSALPTPSAAAPSGGATDDTNGRLAPSPLTSAEQ